MKINIDQLPQQLTKQQNGFWLASDEVFLQQTAADLIRNHAKQAGFVRSVFYIDSQFNWQEVFEQLESRSLFNQTELIELRFIHDKLNDNDRKALQLCCKKLDVDILLLILTQKIEAQSQKAKWFEEIIKTLCFVPIWPIAPQQYNTWLKNRSLYYQLSLEPAALQCLAQQTQGNPLAGDQMLQQLQLLASSSPVIASISKQMVEDISHHAAQTDLFAFVDVFLSAEPAQAFKYLQLLKNQNVEPILIIWALARELRTLNNILLQLAQGHSLQSAFKTYFIWPSRQLLLANACKNFTGQKIYTLIQQLAEIDLQIKGLAAGDPWLALERLLLC